MITTVILLAALAVLMCLLLGVQSKKTNVLLFGNIAEGTHGYGCVTYLTDAAIATRYLLGKIGGDSGHIATAVSGDIPIGIIADEASAAEMPLEVQLLGAIKGTVKMVASAAIAAGAQVVFDDAGKVKTLPVAAGTYYIVGRAVKAAAADGDEFEVAPSFPIQRVVT